MSAKEEQEIAVVKALLLESVASGHLEIIDYDEGGEPRFRLAAAGKAHVEGMLGRPATDPEPSS